MATKKNKNKKPQNSKPQNATPPTDTNAKPKRVVSVFGAVTIDDGAGGALEMTVKLYAISDETKAKMGLQDAPNYKSAKEAYKAIAARRAELRAVPSEVKIERSKKNLTSRIIPQVEKMIDLFGLDSEIGVNLVEALACLKDAAE